VEIRCSWDGFRSSTEEAFGCLETRDDWYRRDCQTVYVWLESGVFLERYRLCLVMFMLSVCCEGQGGNFVDRMS
jgi:hypothetical protein